MAVGRGHTQTLTHERAQTGGVQVGSRPDDAFLGQTAQLPCHPRQDVHRVGNDQKETVGTVLHQLGDDAFEDFDVTLQQVESALPLPLSGASRHHTHTAAVCDLVGGGRFNFQAATNEGAGMLQVQRLAFHLVFLHVHEGEMVTHTLGHDGKGTRHPDLSGSHDGHLVSDDVAGLGVDMEGSYLLSELQRIGRRLPLLEEGRATLSRRSCRRSHGGRTRAT
mmetsp:Transcript_9131/g.22402  ORF Transcript_9131/g.22402 Transcript_9131/m.22402 type:complete len:221 (+) Transcript_9131:701-1363(+)